jgi:hypothetical protein
MTKTEHRRCPLVLAVLLSLVIDFSDTQLVINVRNQVSFEGMF